MGKHYTVTGGQLKHGGRLHGPGDTVELDDAAAARLLDLERVKAVPQKAAKPGGKDPGKGGPERDDGGDGKKS